MRLEGERQLVVSDSRGLHGLFWSWRRVHSDSMLIMNGRRTGKPNSCSVHSITIASRSPKVSVACISDFIQDELTRLCSDLYQLMAWVILRKADVAQGHFLSARNCTFLGCLQRTRGDIHWMSRRFLIGHAAGFLRSFRPLGWGCREWGSRGVVWRSECRKILG